jgi:hypothetical protein
MTKTVVAGAFIVIAASGVAVPVNAVPASVGTFVAPVRLQPPPPPPPPPPPIAPIAPIAPPPMAPIAPPMAPIAQPPISMGGMGGPQMNMGGMEGAGHI